MGVGFIQRIVCRLFGHDYMLIFPSVDFRMECNRCGHILPGYK